MKLPIPPSGGPQIASGVKFARPRISEEVKVLSKHDQHDSAPDGSAPRAKAARSRNRRVPVAAGPDDHGDALRLAVETLSAEICWFLAGRQAGASTFMDSPPRPPTP